MAPRRGEGTARPASGVHEGNVSARGRTRAVRLSEGCAGVGVCRCWWAHGVRRPGPTGGSDWSELLVLLGPLVRRRVHEEPTFGAGEARYAWRRQPEHGDDDPRRALPDRAAERSGVAAQRAEAAELH